VRIALVVIFPRVIQLGEGGGNNARQYETPLESVLEKTQEEKRKRPPIRRTFGKKRKDSARAAFAFY